MEKYTLHCTPEQTKKALELGAPLYMQTVDDNEESIEVYKDGRYDYYEIPTAEQLIGWLINKGIHIEIEYCLLFERYDFCILDEDESVKQRTMFNHNFGLPSYSSRKEATLAAIDAALDYLSKNKK